MIQKPPLYRGFRYIEGPYIEDIHMEAIPFIKRRSKVCFIIIHIHINNLRNC
jgi:hypothetical protein